jgi:hypothetical protein
LFSSACSEAEGLKPDLVGASGASGASGAPTEAIEVPQAFQTEGNAPPGGLEADSTAPDSYPVDPLFNDFYSFLGGMSRLGPAISPLQEDGGRKLQYVEAGLMINDPQATESERFRLAPLGLDFDVAEPALADPGLPGQRFVDGHLLFPEFAPFYEQLGGAQYVGRPLMEARYNLSKERFEQYFENLGFYRLDRDPPGTVRLLAYGAFACNHRCRYTPPGAGIPIRGGLLPPHFAGLAARLGLGFTGRTLAGPQPGVDGRQEVVFENLVLVEEPGATGGVTLRPIVEMLGIEPGPPVEREERPLMVFYAIEGDLGHFVPVFFDDYLQRYGGIEFSGLPIAEVDQPQGGSFRQCFKNLCLDLDPEAPEEQRLRPAPLGAAYQKDINQDDFEEGQLLEGVQLQVWESQSFVASDQPLEIHVAVFEANVPLMNREPVLTLILPDNSLRTYHFPPTAADGQSTLVLPPISAPNGTLIAYEVCLEGLGEDKICEGENYLIWN